MDLVIGFWRKIVQVELSSHHTHKTFRSTAAKIYLTCFPIEKNTWGIKMNSWVAHPRVYVCVCLCGALNTTSASLFEIVHNGTFTFQACPSRYFICCVFGMEIFLLPVPWKMVQNGSHVNIHVLLFHAGYWMSEWFLPFPAVDSIELISTFYLCVFEKKESKIHRTTRKTKNQNRKAAAYANAYTYARNWNKYFTYLWS